ncbi:MAG: GNAT family N-acetyltransferase [Solirubrobacterales bacterium]
MDVAELSHLTDAEADEIAGIFEDGFPDGAARWRTEYEALHRSERWPPRMVVCRHDGRIVAAAMIVESVNSDTTYDMPWLAVRKADRGHGFGRSLATECIRRFSPLIFLANDPMFYLHLPGVVMAVIIPENKDGRWLVLANFVGP